MGHKIIVLYFTVLSAKLTLHNKVYCTKKTLKFYEYYVQIYTSSKRGHKSVLYLGTVSQQGTKQGIFVCRDRSTKKINLSYINDLDFICKKSEEIHPPFVFENDHFGERG